MLEVEFVGQLGYFLECGQELCGTELKVPCSKGKHYWNLLFLRDGYAVHDIREHVYKCFVGNVREVVQSGHDLAQFGYHVAIDRREHCIRLLHAIHPVIMRCGEHEA